MAEPVRFTVFGARGFIGSHLAALLRGRGHEVLTPGRTDTGREAPAGGWGHTVWCIGLTADFRNRPFETVEAHVSALTPLLRADAFESFLYLSSTRVYQKVGATREEAPLVASSDDPSDFYNLTKLTGEALCLLAGAGRARVARLSNVLGPGEAARDTFLGALCREARTGTIRLLTAPASEKDYIWVDDAVVLLAQIAAEGTETIYNVARGRQITHADWASALSRETGASVEVAPDAPTASFPPIDISRMREEFGGPTTNPLDRASSIAEIPASGIALRQ